MNLRVNFIQGYSKEDMKVYITYEFPFPNVSV